MCDDEFKLEASNISTKVRSLRGMIKQQLGIHVYKGLDRKGVKLKVGSLHPLFLGLFNMEISYVDNFFVYSFMFSFSISRLFTLYGMFTSSADTTVTESSKTVRSHITTCFPTPCCTYARSVSDSPLYPMLSNKP